MLVFVFVLWFPLGFRSAFTPPLLSFQFRGGRVDMQTRVHAQGRDEAVPGPVDGLPAGVATHPGPGVDRSGSNLKNGVGTCEICRNPRRPFFKLQSASLWLRGANVRFHGNVEGPFLDLSFET